jgi:hypothetical protein
MPRTRGAMGSAKLQSEIRSLRNGPGGIKCACCGQFKWGKQAKLKARRAYRRIMRQLTTTEASISR